MGSRTRTVSGHHVAQKDSLQACLLYSVVVLLAIVRTWVVGLGTYTLECGNYFGGVLVLLKSFVLSLFFVFSAVVGAEEINGESFRAYVAEVRTEALSRGIRSETLDVAFVGVEPDPRVITFDRRQPEFVQSFAQYLDLRVSESRIRQAREYYAAEKVLLDEIGDAYDVDGEYLVAFWGLETNFGRYQGKYDIVRSLATLGHDARRSAFFTKELYEALHILDEGHVSKESFVGGWAGAMGQNQFMPSTFVGYAVDYDGDGRKDIWANKKDVWASIANYLQRHGWRKDAGWGFKIDATSVFPAPTAVAAGCRALRHHSQKLILPEWQAMGVAVEGSDSAETYALIKRADGDQFSYLVGGNFRAILSYNCANKYAVSVGLLADLI